MNANVGTVDRVLQVLFGLALIALAALGKIGGWGYIGVVPLATGLFRFCPAYSLLGIRTCPVSAAAKPNPSPERASTAEATRYASTATVTGRPPSDRTPIDAGAAISDCRRPGSVPQRPDERCRGPAAREVARRLYRRPQPRGLKRLSRRRHGQEHTERTLIRVGT